MTRKNDALGRTFIETAYLATQVRVEVAAPREYTIAGRYTRPLTDEEVKRAFPPLYDKSGKMLPSVFPSVQSKVSNKKK